MAEQEYDLMHKDDIVASLQLDDLSGAILKVTPGANPECGQSAQMVAAPCRPYQSGQHCRAFAAGGHSIHTEPARAEPRSQSVRPLLDQAERQRTDVERR